MHLLKKLVLASCLPLLLISCGEDVVNNYYGGEAGAFNVNILESEYEIITAHKSYFDPSYVSNGYDSDYQYGMKITIKLDDPSKRANINRIVMSYSGYGYSFNKQELQEAYADSVGGYVFAFLTLDMIRNYSSMIFDVKLYDASNNSSNSYPLITKFAVINPLSSVNDWTGDDDLEISLSAYYSLPAPESKAETHFLNSAYEEIGVYNSDVVNYKWKTAAIPAEAVYYYFILTDKYTDVNRKYISGRYTIKNRLPDNVEFISDVSNPVKIEYIKELDKVLTLSASTKELVLLSYDDNSIIWKKTLSKTPSTFTYSTHSESIYLGYSDGTVDSVNPADGSGENIITCNSNVKFLFQAENYIFIFAQDNQYYTYNTDTKKLSQGYYTSLSNYLTDAAYDSVKNIVYLRLSDEVRSFNFNTAAGTLSVCNSWYFSSSGSAALKSLYINSTGSTVYTGEGYVYNAPDNNGNNFSSKGTIGQFSGLAFVSDAYFAIAVPNYSDYYSNYPSALSVYNYNLVLQGKITGLAGTPKKVFSKNNILKVYSLQGSGSLITQKYTVEEAINSASGKLNRNRKLYIMKKP